MMVDTNGTDRLGVLGATARSHWQQWLAGGPGRDPSLTLANSLLLLMTRIALSHEEG